MSVWTVIAGGLITVIPDIFKKKDQKLLRWCAPAKVWERQNEKPMSARQCRILIKQYVSTGDDARLFVIMRWNAKPPVGPPAILG
jgi:hypothetical protein